MSCKVCDFLYEKLKKAEDRVKQLEFPDFVKFEDSTKSHPDLKEFGGYLDAVEENYRKMAERVKTQLFEAE